MSSSPFPFMKSALQLYLKYFVGVFSINFAVLVFAMSFYKTELNELTASQNYELNLAIWVLHCVLLGLLIFSGNKKFDLIKEHHFQLNLMHFLGSVFLGVGCGIVFPLFGNIGLMLPESNFLHVQAKEGIISFAAAYQSMNGLQISITVLFATVIFSILRELFFRGLLLKLYNKDFNINQSTIQVSLIFILIYTINQINQFDFFSLFLFSVLLCFITFQTKTILPAIIATIAYDLPILYYLTLPDFYLNPTIYLGFQPANALIYLFALSSIAIGIYFFQGKRVSNA
jgi:membrane protease YdiL (CAAX protease family)